MANRIIPDPVKEVDGATTLGWRFLFELCKPADATQVSPNEAADGVLTDFTAPNQDLLNSDGNAAQVADVSVLVNSAPATVSSLDAAAGVFTMSAAPADGATVELTYKYRDLCRHEEVWIKAEDMTDPEDSAEAKTLAVAEAQARRSSWLTALSSQPTKTDQPTLSGDVTL